MDGFLVAALPPGREATEVETDSARKVLGKMFRQIVLKRKIRKGFWEGSRTIDHFGMKIDTAAMSVYVSTDNVERVRHLAKEILLLAQRN